MLLTLPEILQQLRLDESELAPDEDTYLMSLGAAAFEAVQADLGRKVYLTKDELSGDTNAPASAIAANEPIKLAVKLLVGHFYENREATTAENSKQLPLGVQYLLDRHRWVEI